MVQETLPEVQEYSWLFFLQFPTKTQRKDLYYIVKQGNYIIEIYTSGAYPYSFQLFPVFQKKRKLVPVHQEGKNLYIFTIMKI